MEHEHIKFIQMLSKEHEHIFSHDFSYQGHLMVNVTHTTLYGKVLRNSVCKYEENPSRND